MMKNLFDFATKELSQDAFICWLVNNYNNDTNKELKLRAYDFINFISGNQHQFTVGQMLKLTTQQQVKDMDIVIDIWTTPRTETEYENTGTSDYVIIIEDKTDSSIHNNQLVDYGKIIDSWTKWDNKNEKKDTRKVFYKTNLISYADDKELKKYNDSKNERDCWHIYDIESIMNHFKDKKGDSEIYDSFVEYITEKYKRLSNTDKPLDHDMYKWLSFFRRKVLEDDFLKNYPSKWVDFNRYGYAYLCVRVKPYEEDGGPYLEVRSRDCCHNKFVARLLTYGLDESEDYSPEIRNSIMNQLMRNSLRYLKPDKNGVKQLAHATIELENESYDTFMYSVKECIKEFELIMNSI